MSDFKAKMHQIPFPSLRPRWGAKETPYGVSLGELTALPDPQGHTSKGRERGGEMESSLAHVTYM